MSSKRQLKIFLVIILIHFVIILLIFKIFLNLVVRRPDRKDLLAYLCGETAAAPSIDKSAPIELPVSISDLVFDI